MTSRQVLVVVSKIASRSESNDPVLERGAAQVLHGDERLAPVRADVVHGADAGMVQGGGRLGLPLESLQGLRIGDELFGKELESDGPAKARVLGFVDNAHAAAAQLAQDAVVRKRFANQRVMSRPAKAGTSSYCEDQGSGIGDQGASVRCPLPAPGRPAVSCPLLPKSL